MQRVSFSGMRDDVQQGGSHTCLNLSESSTQ